MPIIRQPAFTRSKVGVLAATLALGASLAACSRGGDDANEGASASATASAFPTTDSGAATGGALPNGAAMSDQDAALFMSTADLGEVEANRAAVQKATNAQVKQFAQQMVTDHGKMAREDGDLAKRLGVDPKAVPTTGPVADLQAQHKQSMDQLSAMPKGADWDRAFMDAQVTMHQNVLTRLQQLAGSSQSATAAPAAPPATGTPAAGTTAGDSAHAGHTMGPTGTMTVQQAAQAAIPKVQAHLDKARQIQSTLATGGAR